MSLVFLIVVEVFQVIFILQFWIIRHLYAFGQNFAEVDTSKPLMGSYFLLIE